MKKSSIFTLIILMTAVFSFSSVRFTDNGNGTITDSNTGLIWQKCSNGLSGTDCFTGTATTMTWVNALSYCEGLSLAGRTDWRLPNVNELRSIVDVGSHSPAINTTFFSNTQSSYYWPSSVYVGTTTRAWCVDFTYGNVSNNYKTTNYYVRCVSGP